MRLGDLQFFLLSDGPMRLDGGAMFGVVPKPLWEKKFPADDRNRISLSMNCLLIRTGGGAGKWILVETGGGDKWQPKWRDIYGFGPRPQLLDQLAARGVQPDHVDIVVNTHLHFDHCGGNTRVEDGKIVPTFPNAQYIVQRGELDHAKRPTERDQASYIPENYLPIEKAGRFLLLEGDREIAPGVELVRLPGHTANMQGVRLSSGGKTALFFADLVPTTAHLPFPWILGYDLFPMTTLENKKKWIPEAARGDWLCFFAHDPITPAAFLRESPHGGFVAEPVTLD